MSEDKDEPSNLPTITVNIGQPPAKEFDITVTEDELKVDNLRQANFQMQVLMQLWSQPLTFGKILKLLREQREVIAFRSDVLNLPYGHRPAEVKKDVWAPVDS